MPDIFETNVLVPLAIISLLGLGYFLDRSSLFKDTKLREPDFTVNEFLLEQSSNSIDQVTEVQEEQQLEQHIEQSEPHFDVPPILQPHASSRKRYYNHPLWPSPRPVNFVRHLIKNNRVKPQGRLTHAKAIEILASYSNNTPEDFLKINHITYMKDYMPYSPYLLGTNITQLYCYTVECLN
jgi:hypothetical protein